MRSFGRFYADEPEPRAGMKSGHVPFSLNLPFNILIKNGKLLDEDDIQTLSKDLNIDKNRDIIFMCGSGVTACIGALSFAEYG